MKNILKCLLLVAPGHCQPCYDGTETRGTPEELISTYFVRKSNHEFVHPMANAPFEFVKEVSPNRIFLLKKYLIF